MKCVWYSEHDKIISLSFCTKYKMQTFSTQIEWFTFIQTLVEKGYRITWAISDLGGDGIIETTRWLYCPVCSNKTRIRIRESTVLELFPLFCPKCKKETLFNVRNFNISIVTEPDAKTQSRWSFEYYSIWLSAHCFKSELLPCQSGK